VTIQNEFRQRFPVSSETYWRSLCLDLGYQERLYKEALGAGNMKVIALDGTYEAGMTRRLRFEKPIDAPMAVKKLFGETVSLEEVSEWNPKERRWSYRMIPAAFGDRIEIRGSIRLDENAEGVEQISTSLVSCKVFGVGSVVEHFVAKSSHEGNAQKAAFTRRYITELNLR
jgi:hypothetical protein